MQIDIFTDRYEPVGVADKAEAHRLGLWHRTFSALAVDPSRRRVFLQRKAPGRYGFDRPGHADFTVGGHYYAGEDITDGVRGVREELGLTIAYDDLYPIGVRQTSVTLADDYIEREFQHWHLLPLSVGLEDIPLDQADGEVAGLVELAVDDAIGLADGSVRAVPAHHAIRDDAGVRYQDGKLAVADLIPNYLKLDQLYLRLFIAARRFCDGERTHLFW